tara:strand:+ start:617 stop:832 length:216 start_codon:yes stop_codon:yes gene_type:complete
MSKRVQLEKNIVDTAADYRRYKADADLWNAVGADDDFIESAAAYDAVFAAYDAWTKAKLELARYLKEQDDD